MKEHALGNPHSVGQAAHAEAGAGSIGRAGSSAPADADARDRLDSVMALATDLADMMDEISATLREETAAIRNHAPARTTAAWGSRKEQLLVSYRQASTALQEHHDAISGLPDEIRAGLKERARMLAADCEENAAVLRRALDSQKMIVDMARTALARGQRSNYHAGAGSPVFPGGKRPGAGISAPIALDAKV